MKQRKTTGRTETKFYGKLNEFQKPKLLDALSTKPYLKPLAEKLTSLGGEVPCIWNDSFHNAEWFVGILLHLGRVSNGKGSCLRKMWDNRCHGNAEFLAIKHPHLYQRETGYALSGGVWVPHSWAFDSRNNQIVETTGFRDKYFGFAMVVSDKEKEELKKEGYHLD